MECICLDKNALEIQLPKELPQHRPFVVIPGGVAGLAYRHAQCRGVERHLGNERGSATSRGLNRASQGLAITDKLV